MTALASPANASGEQSGVAVAAVVEVAVVDVITVVEVATVVGATVVEVTGFDVVVGGAATVVGARLVDVAPDVEDTDDSVVDASSPQDAPATQSTAAAATMARW